MNIKNYIQYLLEERIDIQKLSSSILSFLRALNLHYHNAHWETSGNDYYGNHLLFQRLYEEIEDVIDDWAEQMIGTYGTCSVSLLNQFQDMQFPIYGNAKEECYHKKSLYIVNFIQDKLERLYNDFSNKSLGWDDIITGTSKALDKHKYLLQQSLGKKINFLEFWDQNLENIFYQDEEDTSYTEEDKEKEDRKNTFKANKDLLSVRAFAHANNLSHSGGRSGVKMGSGPMTGRFPGGKRQGIS